MRVHELAKEYGIKSTEFVDIIQDFGIDIKSHLSTIDDVQVATIRQELSEKEEEPLAKAIGAGEVKKDDWMDYDPKDPENQTNELVKILQKKYKLLKVNKFASGASFIFTDNKNNPKSEFTINYKSGGFGGGYISYDGVKGQ